MHWLTQLSLAAVAMASLNWRDLQQQVPRVKDAAASEQARQPVARQAAAAPRFLTPQTQRFAVNGTGLPNIDFDVGESYAGSLPISDNANDTNQLFFWFFPSENQTVGNEITIWLTGGPGCSSIGELMSENGPFLWQPGVFKPIRNKWSWHRLTNMVWIDQPIGAGFSRGTVTARDETDVAQQFLGFWRNFVSTFAMQGFKVYITGSSYSGMYCPYIASAMLDQNDTRFFDVAGMQIFDGLYSNEALAQDIPVASFASSWSAVMGFNDSFASRLATSADQCGYSAYLDTYLTFPPSARQPALLPGLDPADQAAHTPGCALFNTVFAAAAALNPCFSPYTITNLCPLPYDPLGFADGTMFVPNGSGPVYFDRPDVKAAIHAPADDGIPWVFCSPNPVFQNGTDASVLAGPGSQPVLPHVIDATQNVILGHGTRDFVLISDGTLLAIQNMTWGGGVMGFQTRPSEPLFVPYHEDEDFATAAGAGVFGTAHTERGLTYFAVAPAGHFLTLDAPAVAMRSLEVLLGRVDGLQSTVGFTFESGGGQQQQPGQADMGNGTVGIVNGGVVLGGSGNGNGNGSVVVVSGAVKGGLVDMAMLLLSLLITFVFHLL